MTVPVEFDVTEHIRSRVRAVLVESIPDEAMDLMIRAEHDKFFATRRQHGRDVPPAFAELVAEELTTLLLEKVRRWITGHSESVWDDAGVERLVGEAAAKIVPRVQEAFMVSVTERALAGVRDATRY